MIRREIADAACAETEDALLLDSAALDPATSVRVSRHLERCQMCQQTRTRLERLRCDVRAGAPSLDDVRRARLMARLAPIADGLASRAASRARRRFDAPGAWRDRPRIRSWAAAGLLAAGGTVAALLIARMPARPARAPTTGSTAVLATPAATAPASAPAVAPSSPAPAAPAVIRPYRVTGAGRRAIDSPLIGRALERLEAPAAIAVRARLGERTDATLVGPAAVSVLSSLPNVLDVDLHRGTLVVDFDHGGGGRLRIHSPGAVTEVVGTLLAVEVDGRGSRISVSRGRVVVQPTDGPPRVVSAGESCVIEPAITRAATTGGNAHRPSEVTRTVAARPAGLMAEHDGRPRARLAGNTLRPPRLAPPALAPSAVTVAPAPSPPVASLSTQPPAQTAPPPATIQAPPPSPERPITTPPTRPAPAPTTVAIAAPPRPRPPPASTEEMYRAAESAMGRRDWPGAQQALEQIITARGGGPLEDVARYELAQLALRAGALPRAAFWLDKVIGSDREPALREPARFLRCDVHVRAGETDDARRCLQAFRARYPASVRDADALGALVRLTPGLPCDLARPPVSEYLRRYPGGADADLAQRRNRSCPP